MVQVALSVWRDEAHGKTRELDADLSLDSDVDDNYQLNSTTTNDISRPLGNAASEGPSTPRSPLSDRDTDHHSLPPSSRASSQPPIGDSPGDDLFDPSTSSNSKINNNASTSKPTAARKIVVDDDDEEESFWKELEMARALRSSQPPPPSLQQQRQRQQRSQSAAARSIDDLDDAEMWAALEEATKQPSVTSDKVGSSNAKPTGAGPDGMDIDDDDDMWDIIRENEKAGPAPPAVAGPNPMASSSSSKSEQVSAGNRSMAESEMDWDDMYAD